MIVITEAEFERLKGAPHDAVVCYLQLRAGMDRATGHVIHLQGHAATLRSLGAAIAVSPAPGLQGTGAPSVSSVRRIVARLERQGLVRREGDDRSLSIRCLLAPTSPRLAKIQKIR